MCDYWHSGKCWFCFLCSLAIVDCTGEYTNIKSTWLCWFVTWSQLRLQMGTNQIMNKCLSWNRLVSTFTNHVSKNHPVCEQLTNCHYFWGSLLSLHEGLWARHAGTWSNGWEPFKTMPLPPHISPVSSEGIITSFEFTWHAADENHFNVFFYSPSSGGINLLNPN